MRHLFIALVLLACSGCTLVNSVTGLSGRDIGNGSDLRIFMDSSCLPREEGLDKSIIGGAILTKLAVGTGKILFKSIGKGLQKAGEESVDHSAGLRGGYFFSDQLVKGANPKSVRNMNSDIRCIHIVREGFAGFATPTAALEGEFADTWRRLELTNQPSLYALIQLDPAEDGSAYFNGTLKEFVVNRYAEGGASGMREFLVILAFGTPPNEQFYNYRKEGKAGDGRPVQPISGGVYGQGGIVLHSVKQGVALNTSHLRGVETGWMRSAPADSIKNRAAFNLYVDLFEVKPGNPILAEFGKMLQEKETVGLVETGISNLVDPDPVRQRKLQEKYTQQTTERRLVRALEDANRTLSTTLKEQSPDADRLLAAERDVEDAIAEIRHQRSMYGWASSGTSNLTNRAQALLSQSKTKRQTGL